MKRLFVLGGAFLVLIPAHLVCGAANKVAPFHVDVDAARVTQVNQKPVIAPQDSKIPLQSAIQAPSQDLLEPSKLFSISLYKNKKGKKSRSSISFRPRSIGFPEAAGSAWTSFFDGWRGAPAPSVELPADFGPLVEPIAIDAQLKKLNEIPRRPDEEFRFAIIGDAEPGRTIVQRSVFKRIRGAFKKLLDNIYSRSQEQSLDFVMQLGDFISRGTIKNYREFLRTMGKYGATWLADYGKLMPYLAQDGNHDMPKPHFDSSPALYYSILGHMNYAFDRGAVRFVTVHNAGYLISPEQLAWLDAVLDTDKIKIVRIHMPPHTSYPSVFHRWTTYKGIDRFGGFKEGADAFVALMSKHKVARVYMGHVHGFGVADVGGVRYILSGGGGSPLYPSGVPKKDRFHHFIEVLVGPNGVTEEIVYPLNAPPFKIPAPRPGSTTLP